jgi:transposase
MEQRYQAVLAVIADGRGVGEVAAQFGVSRQSVHSWLRRYEDHGLEGLANRSHRPKSSPHLNRPGFSSDIDVSGVLFRWLMRI